MDGVALCAQLGEIARQVDAHDLESDALAVRQRFNEGRFYLAGVGMHLTGKGPARWLFDRARSRGAFVAAVHRDAREYGERLGPAEE